MKTRTLLPLVCLSLCLCLAFPALAVQDAETPAEDASTESVNPPTEEVCVSPEAFDQLSALLGVHDSKSGIRLVDCTTGCFTAFAQCLRACDYGTTGNPACTDACLEAKEECDDSCSGTTSTCFPGSPTYPGCVQST